MYAIVCAHAMMIWSFQDPEDCGLPEADASSIQACEGSAKVQTQALEGPPLYVHGVVGALKLAGLSPAALAAAEAAAVQGSGLRPPAKKGPGESLACLH